NYIFCKSPKNLTKQTSFTVTHFFARLYSRPLNADHIADFPTMKLRNRMADLAVQLSSLAAQSMAKNEKDVANSTGKFPC
ncbi:unnamed protein product, partial [Haemonchus placei]|uniref:Ovule protein n=1 Tax=Haemonchus placei TaxID=6290 RepID=A0A0N4WC11_HAEPC